MNTVNGLFKSIISKENILNAIQTAAKGKRKKRIVMRTLERAEETAKHLSTTLANGTWRPPVIHQIKEINDGINRKKREIVCPHFVEEQVVHHAIMNVCKPVFMKKFYRYSCASIPGRGVEYALKYIRKVKKDKRNTKYFVTLDIKSFFNTIRPSKVFHQLRRMIRDKHTLSLFARILRANKVQRNSEIVKRGVPIGFFTSPWMANVLLTPLDNLIKQNVKYYVRYNDDMLLFSSNKRKLKRTASEIESYLHSIGLKLKAAPQIHLFDKNKIRYIGATISRGKMVLVPKIFLKAKRTAKRISIKERMTAYDAKRLLSYAGRFKHLDTRNAYYKYIAVVSVRKCRAIISRQARRKNNVDEKLQQRKAARK